MRWGEELDLELWRHYELRNIDPNINDRDYLVDKVRTYFPEWYTGLKPGNPEKTPLLAIFAIKIALGGFRSQITAKAKVTKLALSTPCSRSSSLCSLLLPPFQDMSRTPTRTRGLSTSGRGCGDRRGSARGAAAAAAAPLHPPSEPPKAEEEPDEEPDEDPEEPPPFRARDRREATEDGGSPS